MNRHRIMTNALASLLFVIALGAAAQAQTRQRTFVSAAGNDANDCSELMPCRNWQPAIDKVIVGGEVVALDSTGFGPINLTRSMTITGEGVHAVSRAADTANSVAVTVNVPGGTVNLRHLYVQNNTGGTGLHGINAVDFLALHIEKVTVNGFNNTDPNSSAVFVSPATAATREVFVKDSILRNNTSGLSIIGNGPTMATVLRTRSENNNGTGGQGGSGFGFVGQVRVTLKDCQASGNINGFFALSFTMATPVEMNIERGVASHNSSVGISNQGGFATTRVSNSTVTNNGTGFSNGGGTFQSRQNNTVAGNTVPTSGTITPLPAL